MIWNNGNDKKNRAISTGAGQNIFHKILNWLLRR